MWHHQGVNVLSRCFSAGKLAFSALMGLKYTGNVGRNLTMTLITQSSRFLWACQTVLFAAVEPKTSIHKVAYSSIFLHPVVLQNPCCFFLRWLSIISQWEAVCNFRQRHQQLCTDIWRGILVWLLPLCQPQWRVQVGTSGICIFRNFLAPLERWLLLTEVCSDEDQTCGYARIWRIETRAEIHNPECILQSCLYRI